MIATMGTGHEGGGHTGGGHTGGGLTDNAYLKGWT